MANKQTAVEQLKNEFFGYADPYPYFSEEDKWVITEREFLELIDKAKATEKKQMELAHIDGGKNQRTAVKYYNETFKSE